MATATAANTQLAVNNTATCQGISGPVAAGAWAEAGPAVSQIAAVSGRVNKSRGR